MTKTRPDARKDVLFKTGTPIIPGVCYGRCLVLSSDDALKDVKLVRTEDVEGEKRLLKAAIESARASIEAASRQVKDLLSEADEGLFQMYESLLDDPTLQERIVKYLDDHLTLPSALALASRSFQDEFLHIKDRYLRERLLDVQDVLMRIMDEIRNTDSTGVPTVDSPDSSTPIILVARELFPSQFLAAPLKRVCGIVCDTGGATSHVAIIARALRIPMMIGVSEIQEQVTVQDKLLVDCRAGICYINPNAGVLKQYQLALNISRRSRQAPGGQSQDAPVDDSPKTLDGTTISLCGNITLFSEIPALHSAGIREIGLYRTEFMFLIRNNMPDEETQHRVLQRLVGGAEGAPVVIRALDIGGDKPLPYIQWDDELNPSLGWRGLRFLLTNPDFARTHLRAILRVCVARNVRLLFPMISDMSDIIRIKAMVRDAQESLRKDGIEYGDPPIGMMLEVPSAALTLERLLPEVDFVSIGTNDLVQYLFAVDRGNARVKQWYQQCHPIVIRLIGDVCRIMSKYPDKELEICGEMGGNMSALPVLIGAGLRKFSMNPAAVPHIRELARRVCLEDCRDLYQQVCDVDTAEQAQRILDDFMESVHNS